MCRRLQPQNAPRVAPAADQLMSSEHVHSVESAHGTDGCNAAGTWCRGPVRAHGIVPSLLDSRCCDNSVGNNGMPSCTIRVSWARCPEPSMVHVYIVLVHGSRKTTCHFLFSIAVIQYRCTCRHIDSMLAALAALHCTTRATHPLIHAVHACPTLSPAYTTQDCTGPCIRRLYGHWPLAVPERGLTNQRCLPVHPFFRICHSRHWLHTLPVTDHTTSSSRMSLLGLLLSMTL
jgi:hypothetical protein